MRKVQVDEQIALGHEPLAVDQRRGRELAHHGGRHQGPGLHEVARLHRPVGCRRTRSGRSRRCPAGPRRRRSRAGPRSGSGSAGSRSSRRSSTACRRSSGPSPGGRTPSACPAPRGRTAGRCGRRRCARRGSTTPTASPLCVAAEVAVAVDEVVDGVRVLLERARGPRGLGRDPVRGGDDALEAEARAGTRTCLGRSPAGSRRRNAGGVLVAGGLLVGDVPERPEADAPLGRVGRGRASRRPRPRSAASIEPYFCLSQSPNCASTIRSCGVGDVLGVERPEEVRVLVDDLQPRDGRLVDEPLAGRGVRGVSRRAFHHSRYCSWKSLLK